MATDDPDEPRVKDMDPATIAQLASWFDLPSFASLEDGAAPMAPSEPSEVEKIKAHRAEVLAQIDPGFLAHLERHRRETETLRKVHPPERPWDSRVTLFDIATVPPAVDPYDLPEVHIPAELSRDLKICTPQAFLRDLHRPEKEFWVRMRSPWDDEDEEPAPRDPWAPIRDTIATRYRLTTLPPAAVSIAASIADLKGLLARPWQESKRGPARAREQELLRKLEGGEAVSRKPVEAP